MTPTCQLVSRSSDPSGENSPKSNTSDMPQALQGLIDLAGEEEQGDRDASLTVL